MTETLLPPAPPPAPGPPLHPPGAPLIPVSRRRFRLAVALPVIAGLLVLAGGGWWVAHSLRTSNAVQAGPEETAAVVNINGSVRGGTVAGSGMIIDAGGLVLTNNHVVANTTSLTAQVAGRGPVYQAEAMGVDPTHAVPVIKPKNASNLPRARLDESGTV